MNIPTITEDPKFAAVKAAAERIAATAAEERDAYLALHARRETEDAKRPLTFFDADHSEISESKARQLREGYPAQEAYGLTPLDLALRRSQRAAAKKADADRALYAEQAAARQRLTRTIEQQMEYRRLVAEFISDWTAQLEPKLALYHVVEGARRHGYQVAPLPPAKYAEIEQLVGYVRDQLRRHVLAAEDVPDALRPLVEAK